MNWISEWFDKKGREFNKLIQGDSVKREKALATGIVSLRDSGLKTFPEYVLTASSKVKVLDATNNDLQELPDSFSDFRILQKVHLAHNKLKGLPPSICLQTITILHLEHNRLQRVPESLGMLKKLRRLELHHNPLVEFPSSIGDLQCLEILDASHCHLESNEGRDRSGLAALARCALLTELRLNNNKLACIPEAWSNLKRLKTLALDFNPIKTVPSAVLRDCCVLQSISLTNTSVTADELKEVPGWDRYEARRQGKHTKQITSNVMLPSKGFDDGLDHTMQ
eukprot:CAMPEP_0118943990 /NCGR_PEP_ID=MMETSP1169-20130426/39404_1 /TAXON_ID=36882 /ORGANISM="Pyramimonas obovata, Strain CCMP722" /LENGTH=280 /DNA_ID=CAMNT_0006889367 /DNA_START=176 /DNA_END=1018 /DNA_ORIENTATION=+